MRSLILLLISLSFSLSQVISTAQKTQQPLPIVQGEKTIAEPLVIIDTRVPEAGKVTVAEPLVSGKVTVAEPLVAGKVTEVEPLVVAGKLTAPERLEATHPGIPVVVPSAPERGHILTPSTPVVVVDGQGVQGRTREREREPQIDVILPQGQQRMDRRERGQIGGRGDIQPATRPPRNWIIRSINDTWVPGYLLIIPGDQVTWVWGTGEAPMMQQQQYVPIVAQHQQEQPLQEQPPAKLTVPAPIQEVTQPYVPIPGRGVEKREGQGIIGAAAERLERVTAVERITAVAGITDLPQATSVGTFGAFSDSRLHNVITVRGATSLEHERNGLYSGIPTRNGNFTHIFTEAGIYWFMCEVHPNEQRGVVVVTSLPETASGVLSQPLLPLLCSILAVFVFNRSLF